MRFSLVLFISILGVIPLLAIAETPAAATIHDGDTIAFLGDSITAGGENHGGYCRLVMHGLRSKGIHVNGIFAGVPGEQSCDMLLRLDSVLQRKPDHLFLLAGVNDVWLTDPTARIGVFKPSPGMGVELDDYKIYITEIIDRCKAADVDVILSTCTPIIEDPAYRLNRKAVDYNAFIRSQAKTRNLPVALLNEASFQRIAKIKRESSGRSPANVLTSDGVHPNGKGSQVMALGILKVMGFTDDALLALEKEWNHAPQMLVVGGRQVRSSTRYTGWLTMVLDVLNSGRTMVTPKTLASKSDTTGILVKTFLESTHNQRVKYILLFPPMADIHQQTPLGDFQASLETFISEAKRRNLQIALSTYAMVGRDPASKLNAAAQSYNEVIRNLAAQQGVGLADVYATMQSCYTEHPNANLNLNDERFNYSGSLLMVEAVCDAFDEDTAMLPRLREVWSRARCYTFRYSDSTSFRLNLSPDGKKVFDEVSKRFHKLNSHKILDFGIHLLLNDTVQTNQQRLAASDTWAALDERETGLSFRKYPYSNDQKERFRAYVVNEGIDYQTFYERAFEVGLFTLRNEDPLGRGPF